MKKSFILLFTSSVIAQMPPLEPPVDPVGNATSADKVMLGKILYWDEQLSSTKTVACASCHILSAGGTDPRSSVNDFNSTNPGADGILGTADDVTGSPGVPQADAIGNYVYSDIYAYKPQVTSRNAPASINAGYALELFFDGRASDTFVDPISDTTVLASGAALESQGLAPPTDPVEMGHDARGWNDVVTTVINSTPLALSPLIDTDMRAWIDNQDYPQLFEKVFGIDEVNTPKIAMAIAAYERSLYSNEAPFDFMIANQDNSFLTFQERAGLQMFMLQGCNLCHSDALFSDNEFHNTGVTANQEDAGRFGVTELEADRGRFRTASLRNLQFRTSFMHNGRFSTLDEVVEFYNRGGDHANVNLDIRIQPLSLSNTQKDSLVAFLGHALTDPRVTDETSPFSHPELYATSSRVPETSGIGIAGTDGKIPQLTAIEPPLLGNTRFTVAVENVVKTVNTYLVVNTQDPGVNGLPDANTSLYHMQVTTNGTTNGADTVDGHAAIAMPLPTDNAMLGKTLYARWYVADEGAIGGFAISPLLSFTLFNQEFIFSSSFD